MTTYLPCIDQYVRTTLIIHPFLIRILSIDWNVNAIWIHHELIMWPKGIIVYEILNCAIWLYQPSGRSLHLYTATALHLLLSFIKGPHSDSHLYAHFLGFFYIIKTLFYKFVCLEILTSILLGLFLLNLIAITIRIRITIWQNLWF